MSTADVSRRLRRSATLRRIADVLGGHETYLAGGALRDRILGMRTHDLDLVVAGDAMAAAERLALGLGGRRPVRLGRPPLVVWRVPGPSLELDVWELEDTPEHDARRRDFTVNALLWRLPDGPLVDVVGGLADLAAGRFRAVSARNLADDPLRVLRGIRLLATHPMLTPDAATVRQLADAAPGLRSVARERVRNELEIILGAVAVDAALRAAVRLGVLATLLPGWAAAGAEDVDRAAGTAAELGLLARRRGSVADAARTVAPGALLPTVGNPESGLEQVGWPARAARRIEDAVAAAASFPEPLSARAAAAREAAVAAGPLVAEALAWRVARDRTESRDSLAAARGLLRWRRRFDALPPLLSGDRVASLLGIPPGPGRARAVIALRLAQARGDVRDPSAARRWLLQVRPGR